MRPPQSGNQAQNATNRCAHCPSSSHTSKACYKARQATPLSALAMVSQLRTAQTSAIECPADVPGLLSNMVHVEATIDGIKVNAFIDTSAAGNVCTCQVAYTVYLRSRRKIKITRENLVGAMWASRGGNL